MIQSRQISTALRASTLVFLCLAFIGCSSLRFPGVYRIAIFQGNFIDQKQVDQVKVGLTRKQIQFLLGSPLVEDTFNPDTWIYHYQVRQANGKVSDKRLEIYFKDDQVVSYAGDLKPRTAEEIAEAKRKREEAIQKRKELIEKLKKEAKEKQQGKDGNKKAEDTNKKPEEKAGSESDK